MFPVGLENFSQALTGPQITFYAVASAINAVLLFYASMKFLLVLQLCGYKGKRYFAWLRTPQTPYLSRLMLLCLMGFLFFCIISACFASVVGYEAASVLGFLSYGMFTGIYINTEKKVNAKVPLNKTGRVIRLCIVYFIILFIVTFGLMTAIDFFAYKIGDDMVGILRYSVMCVMPVLTPFLLYFSSLLIAPSETIIRKYKIKKATLKLKRSQVLKIGITGSFGKTSVKEILKCILSQKYRVLATPASYNTPIGIALAVKQLDSTHDVFIAEIGAKNKGDVREVAQMVSPMYGVLTGVNDQHLESFKTIDNIKETKYELFENLTEGGEGFFSADNDISLELAERFGGIKYIAGARDTGNNLVYATDIGVSAQGTSFTLNVKGEESVRCSTVLLGKHSIKNICLAAAVAYKIGMSPEEISLGINRIQSIGHRLEIMPNNKGIVIIDDSYNANIDGVNAAMEVLELFEGRKIILTPGLVELGKEENAANMKMGKILAKHADYVIIIGRHNAEMLLAGLIEGGMKKENVKFASTLNKGNAELNEILKEGDVVLFENDLPDNYN